jgi:hypothetical protein
LPPKGEKETIRLNPAALKSFNASVKQKKSSVKEDDGNVIKFSMSDLLDSPKKEELPQILRDEGNNSNKITIGFNLNDIEDAQADESSDRLEDLPPEEDDDYIPTKPAEEVVKPKKKKVYK